MTKYLPSQRSLVWCLFIAALVAQAAAVRVAIQGEATLTTVIVQGVSGLVALGALVFATSK